MRGVTPSRMVGSTKRPPGIRSARRLVTAAQMFDTALGYLE